MRIKKYDRDYSRRTFLEKTSKGILSAGVLSSLWPTVVKSDEVLGVYPDEITSLEELSKGKISTGGLITKDNIEHIKDFINPFAYHQVTEMDREIHTHATTMEMQRLLPLPYWEETKRNFGRARFDEAGNVRTDDGTPWLGGNPFPNPVSAKEAYSNVALSWGRWDTAFYAIKEYEVNLNGEDDYEYHFGWSEMQGVGRFASEGRHFKGRDDVLRYQTAFFTYPNDVKGTAFLSIWPNDANNFPQLHGYLPAFKRVRRFPTNQRFEPLIPGATWYLSDNWCSGDPWLTWGSFEIVYRGPLVGPAGRGRFNPDHPNWERKRTGGPKGKSFFESSYEVIPEVIVVKLEPLGYSRAPYSKVHVYIDARNMVAFDRVGFDRNGKIWKNFEQGNGDGMGIADKEFRYQPEFPFWSWHYVMAHDVQANRMSLLEHVEKIPGYRTHYNDDTDYERFLTVQALRRIGS